MVALAVIIISILLILLIYTQFKCRSLQNVVYPKETKPDKSKDPNLILQNINAYFLLIDRDFIVRDTNYYSLNGLPVPEDGTIKRVGDLLHCRNAVAAGECGKHEQCKLCCVRTSITKAFRDKTNFKNWRLL